MTQEQEAICALTGKLAAREKRMREVAEELEAVTEQEGPGVLRRLIAKWRAKLLEGIEAE